MRSAETGVPETGNQQLFPLSKTKKSEAVRSRNRKGGEEERRDGERVDGEHLAEENANEIHPTE